MLVKSKNVEGELTILVQQSIGEYIYTFEGMLQSIRKTVLVILKKYGLKDEAVGLIIIHDSSAKSLLDYFKALLIHLKKDQLSDKNTKNYISKIWKEIQEAMEFRNDIAHAYWFTGYEYDQDGATGIGIFADKHKVMKDGLKNRFESFEQKHLKDMKKKSELNLNLKHNILNISNNIWINKPLLFNSDIVNKNTGFR